MPDLLSINQVTLFSKFNSQLTLIFCFQQPSKVPQSSGPDQEKGNIQSYDELPNLVRSLQSEIASGNKNLEEKLTQATRNLIHNAREILKHSYPQVFILLPESDDRTQKAQSPATEANNSNNEKKGFFASLAKLQSEAAKLQEKVLDRAFFEKSKIYCLCEFQARDQQDPSKMQQCWHPVAEQDGIEIREFNSFMQKVGPVLKASSVILKVVSIGAKLAGVPFPDLSGPLDLVGTYCDKAQDLVGKFQGHYDGLEAKTDEEATAAMERDGPGAAKPKALEGDDLLALKTNYFGDPAVLSLSFQFKYR